MARKPKKPAGFLAEHHVLTRFALGFVVLFVLTVLVANVIGWPAVIPGPGGYFAAALAVSACGFAFLLWEHVRAFYRERRWPNFAMALLLFAGAVSMDTYGVHSGVEVLVKPWRAEIARERASEIAAEQTRLDQQRAAIEGEIAVLQARVDALAPETRGGPQTTEQDRITWAARTKADQDRIDAKNAELDRLPRIAPAPAQPDYITPVVWGFSIFAGLIVAFGVSMLGIEIAPRFAAAREEGRGETANDVKEPPAQALAPETTKVASLAVARARGPRAPKKQWSGWD